ncbi:hypothetical protein QQS21_005612 [Conoideocrella luteorostrata]|uniref:Carrier domain-containing protein n=1 Tax=Conoideocrella luteorostrata TaxID=1105319 RepID=A0AAJ0CS60_9HYPO|nr:hypothetical protein QQS21_005612 [Conoideocrella luteorostrata]
MTKDVVQAHQPKRLGRGKGLQFEIPGLFQRANHIHESEILLLAWSLLLHRYSTDGSSQFAWGLCSDDEQANPTFGVRKLDFASTPNKSISAALKDVQAYVGPLLASDARLAADGTVLFFNDEDVPENASGYVYWDSNAVHWGSIQLRTVINDGSLWLQPMWREPVGGAYVAKHFALAFVEILKMLLSDMSAPIATVLELAELDRSVIWNWNKELPSSYNICIQDLISEQVAKHPTKQAICSWDGSLSYGDVERYSTLLATYLVSLGLLVGDIVPLCFEKSKWTTVAVMAVMKAGAAFVLMDPSQPLERRKVMAEQVKARFIITSEANGSFGPEIAPGAVTVVVSDSTMLSMMEVDMSHQKLPYVSPESTLYIIFTSGSTGKPKGVVIGHGVYTTSALARSTDIGYSDVSRVLDFTSYAFDVSIDSILSTLLRGGCLCIPSDQDRMNDLSGAMRRLGVNMANMTPSVARILDPDIIPSLYSLGIGGEACSAGDIANWGQHTRVVVGYGPAECTIGCTVNPNAAGKPYVSMGSAKGCAIWLVHPDDHNKLMPVGAVGELLIEGPIVGQGYLGDSVKTEAAFIRDPTWLVSGHDGIPGRRGRLYKTGDLVRYDPDGECGFVFVGRKDSQVKLRGQRVELGEIEHHIKKLLPVDADVVAEVIAPEGQKTESMLVAFVAGRNHERSSNSAAAPEEPRVVELSAKLQDVVAGLNDKLSKILPIYMVPSTYIGMSQIPMLVSGKIDRKTLRSLGSHIPLHCASADGPTTEGTTVPTSETEKCLQVIWSRLLKLKEDQIYANRNFFMLGGDSILAMKLVPAVREEGYELTVADVFGSPVLAEMAKIMKKVESASSTTIPAFSLLDSSWDREGIRIEAAEHCGISPSSIEDIYPCAPMQEIHMAFYTRSKEAYVAQRITEIPTKESAERLQAAWDAVIRKCAILRTRIVEFKHHGFLQVVTNDPLRWQSHDNLQEFLVKDKNTPMPVNKPLSRFTMVHDVALDKYYFVWTAHHAVYDAWSTELIVDHVEHEYNGRSVQRTASFKHFIQFLADPEREKSRTYWLNQLNGATGPQFPSLPSRSYIPEPNAQAEHFITVTRSSKNEITASTVMRAAWALVASKYTMNDDIVFGETFTGRTLPIPGIEQIEGPVLATVPVRVRIDRTASIHEFLQSVQDQGVARTLHEHFGIQNIRRLSPDAQIACEVSMGMVIQPPAAETTADEGSFVPSFAAGDAALEALHFNTYPVMLACCLQPDGFRVVASFDSHLVSESQMRRVLLQLDCAVSELVRETDRCINQVLCLSREELEEIWSVNSIPPVSHRDVAVNLRHGDTYPMVQHIPWIVDPEDTNVLMPVGTTGELLLEGVDDEEKAKLPAPTWLKQAVQGVTGRHGKLHQTGHLVRYSDNFKLIYIGNKADLMQFNGHIIDVKAIDRELIQLLPAGTEVSTQLIQPEDSSARTPIVVSFVREQALRANQKSADLGFTLRDAAIPLCSIVSVDLVESVARLKKAMLDALPPYMIPKACIPISTSATKHEDLDSYYFSSLAQSITLPFVAYVRQCFSQAHSNMSEWNAMSPDEIILRSCWAKFLGIDEKKIALDDNFFRLGGDSILAMRIVSALRVDGYVLSVADMFRNMKLRDMANVLKDVPTSSSQTAQAYTAFSMLGYTEIDSFLTQHVRDQLADPEWIIEDAYPVTDPQARDVKRTVSRPRSSVQYNMLHISGTMDVPRLLESFQHLVGIHPILRTVFVQHNDQILQVVLKALQIGVSERNCAPDETLDQFARRVAEEDIIIDSSFQYGSSFLRIFVLRHTTTDTSLMIRISHAQYDGISLPELLKQLDLCYNRKEIFPSAPFTSYLNHIFISRAENVKYWSKLLSGSTMTEITSPADAETSTARFFTKAVDVSGRSSDITFATVLTAGWARVLAKHRAVSDVTFAGIVSGRSVAVNGIEHIMGPCYQYMPVRVRFEPGWTAKQLLEHVRDLYLEGSAHATLGYAEIAKECTEWEDSVPFYASFVNHLDNGYFDTMPFGDGECRVDYTNPHAEIATPPRVVSFIERGNTFVGIEADGERWEFWEAKLEELAEAVEMLARDGSAVVL